jgi:hypothetical protein
MTMVVDVDTEPFNTETAVVVLTPWVSKVALGGSAAMTQPTHNARITIIKTIVGVLILPPFIFLTLYSIRS